MSKRTYAIVRVDNRKHSETYSDPIMVGDSLDELQMKLGNKVGGSLGDDLDLGFGDGDDWGGGADWL